MRSLFLRIWNTKFNNMENIDYVQLAKDKLLEKGLKGLANHTSIPKMMGEICSELVKNNAVLPLVSKMLPDLERCKNAADNYADLDGTGQYGLVRKSFNDGINWALNFIVKQK